MFISYAVNIFDIEGVCIDGPFGGNGGNAFDVTSPGDYIESIRVCQSGNGLFSGLAAGFDLTLSGTGGTFAVGCYDKQTPYMTVSLNSGEVITEVDVYVGTSNGFGVPLVEGLTFRTSEAREFGPFGLTTGTKSTSSGSRLNGFVGRAGHAMDQISFVWESSSACGEIY